MKNVRLFYKKSGPLRFASHLDMNRFMTRLIRLSKVPIWYTEGFNRHPYITFALPLSLGFSSDYEVMDFRFEQDDFSLAEAKNMIASVCPDGIEVIALEEPVYKPGKIAMADFIVTFSVQSGIVTEAIEAFLSRTEILVAKTTKRGGTKELNLAEKILSYSVLKTSDDVVLTLRLPAGGQDNVNPKILIDAFLAEQGCKHTPYAVRRTALLLEDGTIFK